MIIVELLGGLGNQMFQYAAGRAVALRAGLELKLDATGYAKQSLRAYRLNVFNIVEQFADDAEIYHRKPRRRFSTNWLRYQFERTFVPFHRRTVIVERTLAFDPAVLRIRRSAYLAGFWQSDRYFADYADRIRADFTFKEPPSASNRQLLESIAAGNAVSLHVRRGDYVADPTVNRYHGVLSPDYYRAAVAHILESVPKPHFYVFSDDIPWVKQALPLPVPVTYVEHNGPTADYEDLRLMSRCNHHIIANSSFSWWGAWLAQAPGQIVIAPRHWFSGIRIDATGRVPDGWLLF